MKPAEFQSFIQFIWSPNSLKLTLWLTSTLKTGRDSEYNVQGEADLNAVQIRWLYKDPLKQSNRKQTKQNEKSTQAFGRNANVNEYMRYMVEVKKKQKGKRNFLFNNAPRSWLRGNEKKRHTHPIYIDLT